MKKAPTCASTSGVSSDMISRDPAARSRWPCRAAPVRARLDFSQSCCWLAMVVSRRLAIIWLMLSLRSPTSPGASTVIVRSSLPRVTAVATSAIARTWVVRLPASWLTFSVSRFQVPETPGTSACPPRRPSVPTSRATRVTSAAKLESWSTIVLMVFLSSSTSPFTSTVIFFERSPACTALVTSAMFLTCEVRFDAMKFTDSVRSFQVPATPCTSAWPPSLPSVPGGKGGELVHHRVDRVLEREHLAFHVDVDLLREVALRHRGGHVGDVAPLRSEVAGHRVHVVGEALPAARHALHLGLAAKL